VTALRSESGKVAIDKEALFLFMMLMRVRVPAARDMVEISLAEQVKATARLLDRLGELPPRPEGIEDILDRLEVSIDPHQSLQAMTSLAQGFSLVLDHLGFEVLHNKTGVGFLTSDYPVIYFDPTVGEGRVSPYQVRPPHGAIELLFPIDAETVLRGRTGRAGLRHLRLTDPDPAEARRINRFIVRFGYRLVFARNRSEDAVIARHAATSPVLKSTTVPSLTSGNMIYSECVFGQRPVKSKWDADGSQSRWETNRHLRGRRGSIAG
jgi:Protein of unknown function (DUF4238)